jgi:hypothetical protein
MRFGTMASAILLASAVTWAAAATAAPTAPAGGQIYIHATGGTGPAGTIVVVGAIGDHGTTLTIDKDGKPDANGNFVKVTLQKGTFQVDSTALNAKMAKQAPLLNKKTCSFMIAGSDRVTLFDGTGLYRGISGSAAITIAFGGIGPDYASGPQKGQCNTNNSAKPVATFGSITGPGTVAFG